MYSTFISDERVIFLLKFNKIKHKNADFISLTLRKQKQINVQCMKYIYNLYKSCEDRYLIT
jgi:hypothetical protein